MPLPTGKPRYSHCKGKCVDCDEPLWKCPEWRELDANWFECVKCHVALQYSKKRRADFLAGNVAARHARDGDCPAKRAQVFFALRTHS